MDKPAGRQHSTPLQGDGAWLPPPTTTTGSFSYLHASVGGVGHDRPVQIHLPLWGNGADLGRTVALGPKMRRFWAGPNIHTKFVLSTIKCVFWNLVSISKRSKNQACNLKTNENYCVCYGCYGVDTQNSVSTLPASKFLAFLTNLNL